MNVKAALVRVDAAAADGQLSGSAAANIRQWLTEPRYAAYVPAILAHVAEGRWQPLDDVFWTVIPFGTGGRRGRMYEIGTNAINERTIGESARGLADYVLGTARPDGPLACAIAYDTRHRSRQFAELCAGILVAAGFRVYLLDDYRSTPELSFLVRQRRCACGIMVTASHNPPSDNAVKVYWSTGGQIVPPHDAGIIACVQRVEDIPVADVRSAAAAGQLVRCTVETDDAYLAAVAAQGFGGPRAIRILYSPLHGVGASAVEPLLARAGFRDVEMYAPQAAPDGDFPNVPGHVANPENVRVFDALIEHAAHQGADLVLVTDPDADRLGCAAPRTLEPGSPWGVLSGNQIGALLADYVLAQRQTAGTLSPRHYVVKTLVTTELIRSIADAHGVRTCGDLHVGFKWIGARIDQEGPDGFVLGCEESHGYLVGTYARDKDGVVACLLMAELAARLRAQGRTLHDRLDELARRHGVYSERLIAMEREGAEGLAQMQRMMHRLRTEPPRELGQCEVTGVLDYLQLQVLRDGLTQPLAGPRGDMVVLEFAQAGHRLAVRPSGTEPRVKIYLFAHTPPEQLASLAAARRAHDQWFDQVDDDFRTWSREL